jgi:hypothetical protein
VNDDLHKDQVNQLRRIAKALETLVGAMVFLHRQPGWHHDEFGNAHKVQGDPIPGSEHVAIRVIVED